MPLRETAQLVRAYADGLLEADAVEIGDSLTSIADFLAKFGNRRMSELVRAGTECRVPSEEATRPTTRDVIPHLEKLCSILKVARASNAAKDLRLLIKLLGGDSVSLSSMLEALRRALTGDKPADQVSYYVEQLNKQLGSDAFERTLEELKTSRLRREDVVAIALEVYGRIPKRTTRTAALNYIRKVHAARLSARRGAQAMKGRSAA